MRVKAEKRLRAITLCLLVLAPFFVVETHSANAQSGLSPGLKITLLVPTSNSARRTWATIIENNLDFLGIEANRVEVPFSPNMTSRVLAPDSNLVGKNYDEGGFDIVFLGNTLGIDADPWPLYHSSQFAPTGQNYYLWNDTQNDELSTQIKETIDKTARLDLVKQWQVLAREELPSIPILYTREIVAFDASMSNAQAIFTQYHAPAWPPIEHLVSATGLDFSLVLAQTGQAPGEGIIPELSSSYYDTTISNEIFSSLAMRNDTTFKTMVPQLASGTVQAPGWYSTPDNKNWTVTLRPGISWHDGVPFNATDVKFTFDSIQDDALAAPIEAFVRGIIGGKNQVKIIDQYTVEFDLSAPYAFFVQNILTYPIIPEHILKSIPLDQWMQSKFNHPDLCTPAPGDFTCTVAQPPIGTGPYKWVDWNPTTSTAHLTRNDNYFDFPDKGYSALAAKGQFKVKDYYVRNIVDTDTAISTLRNGEVNVLDSQYHMETQPSFLVDWGLNRLAIYDAFGVQEIGVNMKHSLLGTGFDTPLARQHPGNISAASLAAKYLRQAISYAVPRDQIISQLLNGYGSPAITTPVVGNYKTGFAVTEGFNRNLTPYDFNLTKSEELLRAAGYIPASQIPTFLEQTGLFLIVALVAALVAVTALYIHKVQRRQRLIATQSTQHSGSASQ